MRHFKFIIASLCLLFACAQNCPTGAQTVRQSGGAKPMPTKGNAPSIAEFSGFRFHPIRSRIFPIRIIGGQTNLLAALWQWEDDNGSFLKPSSKSVQAATPTKNGFSMEGMARPLADWAKLAGKVVSTDGKSVTIEIEKTVVLSETTKRVTGGDSYSRMGIYIGGEPAPAYDKVIAREVQRVKEQHVIENVPGLLKIKSGDVFNAYVRTVGERKYDFGLLPKPPVTASSK